MINEYIKKLANNKYRVYSKKGKNLGTMDSKNAAKKRLKQIHYFKSLKENETNVPPTPFDFAKSTLKKLLSTDKSKYIDNIKLTSILDKYKILIKKYDELQKYFIQNYKTSKVYSIYKKNIDELLQNESKLRDVIRFELPSSQWHLALDGNNIFDLLRFENGEIKFRNQKTVNDILETEIDPDKSDNNINTKILFLFILESILKSNFEILLNSIPEKINFDLLLKTINSRWEWFYSNYTGTAKEKYKLKENDLLLEFPYIENIDLFIEKLNIPAMEKTKLAQAYIKTGIIGISKQGHIRLFKNGGITNLNIDDPNILHLPNGWEENILKNIFKEEKILLKNLISLK